MVRFLGRLFAGWCLSLGAIVLIGYMAIMLSVKLGTEAHTAAHEKAITRNHPQGEPLFSAAECQPDNPETIKACRYMAAWGDIDMQYALGLSYETGSIAPKDNKEAARWYEEAALQGHLAALYKVSKAKSADAYKAEENVTLHDIIARIEAYAWYCVWDRQMLNPQATGRVMWNNLTTKDNGIEKDFRDTFLKNLAAMPLPTRMIAKRLCHRYIEIMLGHDQAPL